jgi:hypothetical protein
MATDERSYFRYGFVLELDAALDELERATVACGQDEEFKKARARDGYQDAHEWREEARQKIYKIIGIEGRKGGLT